MTLTEILSLEETTPCPGCPVCKPRVSRTQRGRRHGGRLASRGDERTDVGEESGLSSRERLGEKTPPEGPSKDVLEHQEKAMVGSEPFDALWRDAAALGVKLSVSLPLPERGRPGGRYYADWLDEERRRQPALDTDIHLWVDPTGLIGRCLEAVAGSGGNEIVVLGERLVEVARISF